MGNIFAPQLNRINWNFMETLIIKLQSFGDGFFYFWGFMENPAKKEAYKTIYLQPSEKIKSDLRRMNSDYRKTLKALQKELNCPE